MFFYGTEFQKFYWVKSMSYESIELHVVVGGRILLIINTDANEFHVNPDILTSDSFKFVSGFFMITFFRQRIIEC